MSNAVTDNEDDNLPSENIRYSSRNCYILNTRLDYTDYDDACDRIQRLARLKQSSYVVAANVHVIMTARWNTLYHEILSKAALVTPDGVPLMLGMRWLGNCFQPRVYGPDLMLALCSRAAQNNIPIYLYGGTTHTLHLLSERLSEWFPLLEIAGKYSPPFRNLSLEEEATDVERIQQSGAAIVFVGLGCPKQEEWMYRQQDRLNAVMIGVGAAFKFHSGEITQAPPLMMKLSLEWLFRLMKEPRRLWSRYLFTNPAFILLFSQQIVRHYIRRITVRLQKFHTLSE